jgi:hypothetical protein
MAELTKRSRDITADTVRTISDVINKSTHPSEVSSMRLDQTDASLEAKAASRRAALAVEPVPFLEVKSGGLIHLDKKKRGAKVLESYYGVPGLDNVVMLERRKRSNGELISQTLVMSPDDLRHRGQVITLPPRTIASEVDAARSSDAPQLEGRTGWRDYISGYNTPQAFDGPQGVYARNGATTEQRNQLRLRRQTQRLRRGGLLYRYSRGRI